MKSCLSIPQEKKLTVIIRVEPGCLGPMGHNYIEDFCRFAQKQADLIEPANIHWTIGSRLDKTLPETEYKINNRKLTPDQAKKYLAMLEKDIEDLESSADEMIVRCIEQFLGR